LHVFERKARQFQSGKRNCSGSREVGMRVLILLVAIVLVLAVAGWISFSKSPDRTSINIESERIRQDTKQVMESGAQVLHKAGDKVEAEANREPSRTPNDRRQ
jgi:cytoskeletal protein RodZ